MTVLRNCPVCDSSIRFSQLFLKENIDPKSISSFSFASRKLPEYMNHQLVRCEVCDLVYVSTPPDQNELAANYHVAEYDSSEEADDAAQSYINVMRPVLAKLKNKDGALDIGSGTGILLEFLQREGFRNLVGVEPSSAAILAAPAYRRNWLMGGIFDENLFAPNSFSLVCCFMTMEHVREPKLIASAVNRILAPGGVFVTITHDYRSLTNKLLGKRSPIIDIEHMQLFSKKSIANLLTHTGFDCVNVKSFANNYSLLYWVRLLPIPKKIKKTVSKILAYSGLGKIKLKFNVADIIAFAHKPE